MVIHQEAIGDALEDRPVSSCRHHWIIETANGPSSRGVCQNCQESKLFSNSIVEFERDVHNLQPAGRIDHSLKDTTTEQ